MECTAEGFATLHPLIQEGIKKGWPDFQNCMKFPNNTPYGLVAQNLTTNAVTNVGSKATIVMKPGETLRFVLNDYVWDCGNNAGSIKVSWSAVNLVPKVMKFDGDKDYVRLPDIDLDYSKGFTAEAWVWVQRFGLFTRIIEFCNGQFVNDLIFCFGNHPQTADSGCLVLGVYNPSGSLDRFSPTVIERGKWLHVAVTVDARGTATFYKNSQQIGSPQSGPAPTNIKRTVNTIGADLVYPDNRDFAGNLAEVRVWSKVRTQAEIQADMFKRLTGKEPGLAGYWPLNDVRAEGSALKVADLTGNFPGTVTGAVLFEDSTFPVV